VTELDYILLVLSRFIEKNINIVSLMKWCNLIFFHSLCTNINRLDARCEDLQRCLDEARHLVETSERKNKSVNQNSSIDVEKKISRSGQIQFLIWQ
jgi:hypothetical protein